MYTIGELVKEFGLSRSTLLYYDKIGLLRSQVRSDGNYRLFTQADFERLTKIVRYKSTGLSLQEISKLLDSSQTESVTILEQRLESLNAEVSRIRAQQKLIVTLLEKDSLIRSTKTMNKSQWVKIMQASGIDEAAMRLWHIEFEKDLPNVHSDFLESLGISKGEIAKIKSWSKTDDI